MSLLASLSTDASIEDEKDSIGQSAFESDCYLLTITSAYINKSDGGALGLVTEFKTEDNRTLKQTFWMTSGTAKGCNNYYIDKNGDKKYLPGFLVANSLALLTTGKEISALDTETKVVKKYSKEVKAEVPTKVEMVMELLNQEIYGGVIKQIVDKTEKADDGSYVPTGETREENEIDKFFRAKDKKTTAEIRNEQDSAEFFDKWINKHKGNTKDKSKGASGSTGAPKVGNKAAPAGAKKPTTSLFGN